MPSPLTLWYSLLFSHSRSFSMDLLIYGATATLDGNHQLSKKSASAVVRMWNKRGESFSPSCWGRWPATNWSPMYSNSRGSHRGATAHWLATSSSGSCLHGWYWLWILLVPPEETHVHDKVNAVAWSHTKLKDVDFLSRLTSCCWNIIPPPFLPFVLLIRQMNSFTQ